MAACALLLTAPGCDKTEASAPHQAAKPTKEASGADAGSARANTASPQIVYAKGPPPKPTDVIAHAGPIEVTVADFDKAMHKSLLVAPAGMTKLPKERLAIPQLQLGVTRNLMGTKIIEREAKRRGLKATDAEKFAALNANKRLARYADALKAHKPNAALTKRGVSLDDLDAVATELVLRNKLRDALLANVSDDTLWKAYVERYDRAQLLLASVLNTPTMDEISDFIDQHHDRIEAYFESNKRHYRIPEMVHLITLAPKPGHKADPKVLKKAAHRLANNELASKIGADLGLVADDNAMLVRGENPVAFHSKPDKTGFETKGPRGAYAWKVVDFQKSKPAKLDGSTEREIAARLLRQHTAVPSKKKRIEKAIALMEKVPASPHGSVSDNDLKRLRQKLQTLRLQIVKTKVFSHNARGFIPGVGLAEEVAKQAFASDMSHPVSPKPILSRDKLWAFRLLKREHASRKKFGKDKKAFKKEFDDAMKGRVLDQFVDSYEDAKGSKMNLKPLQIKYGTMKKRRR